MFEIVKPNTIELNNATRITYALSKFVVGNISPYPIVSVVTDPQ